MTSFQVQEETVPHPVEFCNDHQQSPGANHSKCWYLPPRACILAWPALCCTFKGCVKADHSDSGQVKYRHRPHWKKHKEYCVQGCIGGIEQVCSSFRLVFSSYLIFLDTALSLFLIYEYSCLLEIYANIRLRWLSSNF